MEDKKLLADSDFFIALYKEGDSNYEQAREFLEKVKLRDKSLIISEFSYSEVVTVLAQNTTHRNAINFMEDLDKSNVEIVAINKTIFESAKKLFKSQNSKNVSFVDVINIAICGFYNLSKILSFDEDYKKNDLKRYGID